MIFIKNLKSYFSKFIMEVKTPLYLKNPKLYNLNTKLIHREGDLF